MSKQYEMRMTGSGGQGVILASIILAQAALAAGMQTTQSQSYGPEARGGMCKAETIISNELIGFTKVTKPDFVLALTQDSLNKYSQNISDSCIVMADASLDIPAHLNPENVIHIPILETATEKVGKALTANIVSVGAINKALRLFHEDVIKEATLMEIPKGMEDLNMKALQAGMDLVPSEAVRPVTL